MIEVKNELQHKYTQVFAEEEFSGNAPSLYVIKDRAAADSDDELLGVLHFQHGPIGDAGINGVMDENLLQIVIDRLEHFQQSEFRCRENAIAITKLEEALLWLRKRTMNRELRGVEGTHEV